MHRPLLAVLLLSTFAATTQPAIPTTQPATQPQERSFTSMPDILNKVPEKLRPQATYDWHKYTENKFKEWVAQQMIGMTFDEEVQFGGATAMPNTSVHPPGQEWTVPLGRYSHRFSCFGTLHTWTVYLPAIFTDEAGAKKWESYKPGTRIRLTGIIKSVVISPHALESKPLPQYDFAILLDNRQLTPLK